MSREGMRQLVSERTQQAMDLIPREKLCPTKNMTPEQIVDYRRRIGQKISENYNEETKRKCLESREKHFANNIEAQNKIINAARNNHLKTISEPQRPQPKTFTIAPFLPSSVISSISFSHDLLARLTAFLYDRRKYLSSAVI